MLIDDDPRRDRQASFRRQFDIGQDADTDHDKVGRQMAAVAEADAGHLGAIALDAGGLHAQMNANAGRGVPLLKIIRNLRGHRARHDARSELDHVHLETLDAGGGGELETDKTRTDHDDPLARRDLFSQCLALVEDSQVAHVCKIGVGNVEQAVARAGRQHQMPVIQK